MKMLAAAIFFSSVMTALSLLLNTEWFVFFNILHLLAVGCCLQGLFTKYRDKRVRAIGDDPVKLTGFIRRYRSSILFFILILFSGEFFFDYFSGVSSVFLLPFGVISEVIPGMWDYLPLFPWLAFFFIGVLVGDTVYAGRQPCPPPFPAPVLKFLGPLLWMGRNALFIYLFHQPVLVGVLILLRAFIS